MRAAATQAAGDPEVRGAVVLWGGERVFAAGADIKEFVGTTYAQMAVRAAALSGGFHRQA